MSSNFDFNYYVISRKPKDGEKIFLPDYEGKLKQETDYEVEVVAELKYLKDCVNQYILMEIVKDNSRDIRVRMVAADKITNEVILNYILISINNTHSIDNFKITLFLAKKATDEDVVNIAMEDILSASHFFAFCDEIFEQAIACTTSVSVLEKFIAQEEKHNATSKLIDVAYNRAMELLEKG